MSSTNWSSAHSQIYGKSWICFQPGNYPATLWISTRAKHCEFEHFPARQRNAIQHLQGKNEWKVYGNEPFWHYDEDLWAVPILSNGSGISRREDGFILSRSFAGAALHTGTPLHPILCTMSLMFKQENYVRSQPARVRNLDGPEKVLKQLELMDSAASSLSDSDLVDSLIHG